MFVSGARNPEQGGCGLLALAKGATPDSGGRERPISRSRLKHELVLPHAHYYYYYYYYYYCFALSFLSVAHWSVSFIKGFIFLLAELREAP